MRAKALAEQLAERIGHLDGLRSRERVTMRPPPAEQPLGLVQRLVPAELLVARPPAAERIDDAILRLKVPVGETALVAQPAAVDLGMVAREDPADAPSRVVALMLQPTGHMPQTVGTFWISHGRASNLYVVEVSAPTGQSSITLPLKRPRYGSSSKVAITDNAPRFLATSCPSSATSSEKRVQR